MRTPIERGSDGWRRISYQDLAGYDNILAELRHEMLKWLIQIERPIRPVWAY